MMSEYVGEGSENSLTGEQSKSKHVIYCKKDNVWRRVQVKGGGNSGEALGPGSLTAIVHSREGIENTHT